MPTITDLPPEIILQIHLLAQNPLLPQAHPSLYHPLHTASTHYVATYLLALYSAYGADEVLVRALRHPVCDVQVARDIRSIWGKRRGYHEPVEEDTRSRRRKGATGTGGEVAERPEVGTEASLHADHTQGEDRPKPPYPDPPEPTAPALSCSELPRRLFRPDPTSASKAQSSSTPPIHPLLEYLFSTYRPSPNSHKGYPLCRAVLTSNTRLISFLLSRGADPGIKDCLPVEIAVQMRDLVMIKLLVERLPADTAGSTSPGHCSGSESGSGPGTETPSPRGEKGKKGKRIKLGDRVTITSKLVEAAIKSGSDDIVHYFVHEKGIMPPLRSIMKLGKPDDARHPGLFANKSTRRTSTPTRSHVKRAV